MIFHRNKLQTKILKIVVIYLFAILLSNIIVGIFVPLVDADSPPSGVILYLPVNNIYINDSTPTLNWYPSFDADGDPLKYDVEIYDNQNVLVANNLTNLYTTTWTVTPPLPDGQTYHWHVRANDTLGQINSTGPWSPFWYFTVDISPPSILTSSADFTTYTGTDFNISANFTDNTGVVFSNLYYIYLL